MENTNNESNGQEKKTAEAVTNKYAELYDYAPTGYFTLSKKGDIIEMNLCGSQMLGKERSLLTNNPFVSFVSSETKPNFSRFLEKVFNNKAKETCEVTLIADNNLPVQIHLTGIAVKNEDQCLVTVVDITPRNQEEQAFIVSETHYLRLFESATDGILILDAETGKIRDVNPFLIEMFGYSKEHFIEKAVWEIGFFKDIASNKEKFQELQQKKYIRYENLPLEAADGRLINVEFIGNVYSVNRYMVIQCSIRDLSDHKQAEQQLQYSEMQFWSLTENSPDMIARFNHQCRYLYVNPATARSGHFRPVEYIGKSIVEAGIPEAAAKRWEARIKSVFETGLIIDVEDSFETPNGTQFFDIKFVPEISPNGTIDSVQTIARDITRHVHTAEALRRKAERLRNLHKMIQAILQAIESPEVIAQTALPHLCDLLQCQRASVGIFDFETKEVMVFSADADGNAFAQAGKKLSEDAYSDLEILRQGKIEIVEDVYRVSSSSAVTRILQAEGIRSLINVPLLSAQGLYGVLNIGWKDPKGITQEESDITREVAVQITIAIEQARLLKETRLYAADLEKRVGDRTAQLEAANKEMETFSYSVSHDLRAPLRHISGFIGLFLEHKSTQLTEEELGFLAIVSRSAEDMGNLIDALLSFSRLNRTELRKSNVDTLQLINQSFLLFTNEISAREINIKIGPLPQTFGDLQLMRQVWTNLISNAIKYTEKREIAFIEIGSYNENCETIFFIKDNGAGFNMKYAHKLFGVFQRLHKPSDFEGIGIGLANINRIITRHGGRCWASGETDKGATFYFCLPCEIATSECSQ